MQGGKRICSGKCAKGQRVGSGRGIADFEGTDLWDIIYHGEDGYPYGVPVNYVVDKDKIYFHCAKDAGHKVEKYTLLPKGFVLR